MEREVEYNTELTKIQHTNYVRNSRAIVMLWGIFTIIYTVLNIVVFLQPQWIGDTGDSAVAGYIGIWEYCVETTVGGSFVCYGNFLDFNTIINDHFKATSVCVALSCLLFAVSIMCFVLFCLLNTATVLRICGWFQLIAGVLMLCAIFIFPGGWDHVTIQEVCGTQAGSYDLGVCGVRWAFVLAIVLVFDAFIMAILAFVLAAKQANLLPAAYKDDDKERRQYYSSDNRMSDHDSDIYRSGSGYYMSQFDLHPHHHHPQQHHHHHLQAKSRGGYSNDSFIMD